MQPADSMASLPGTTRITLAHLDIANCGSQTAMACQGVFSQPTAWQLPGKTTQQTARLAGNFQIIQKPVF